MENTAKQIPSSFLSEADALDYFDSLSVAPVAELAGLWQGHGVASEHPLDGVLENLGWYGKRFAADLRADALLFAVGPHRLVAIDPALIPLRLAFRFHRFGRTQVARNLFLYLQKIWRAKGPVASLRPMSFRGKTSAAMVYDSQPITDHFRRIDEDRLLGVMAVEGDSRYYFFVLTRVGTEP
ncbi:DUF4334 domain-containing protein [Rhizobium leucaenae]|uniref:DUF4334 domain-containing protein n=1 Tax=Rhizobium leucaenae TaxID=29450 RepID=A0A7W6ZU03_9HYPH|nr:DUF4334 domain-containing protein [Rhizobium leucaenae]MBB4568736.1 hypothetical protein [Rhizobium leucaenae]MBB6302186.1 hypothetical protein [Rhizobium leucaenae]